MKTNPFCTPYFKTHLTTHIANMIKKNEIRIVKNVVGKIPILAVKNLKKSDEPSKTDLMLSSPKSTEPKFLSRFFCS